MSPDKRDARLMALLDRALSTPAVRRLATIYQPTVARPNPRLAGWLMMNRQTAGWASYGRHYDTLVELVMGLCVELGHARADACSRYVEVRPSVREVLDGRTLLRAERLDELFERWPEHCVRCGGEGHIERGISCPACAGVMLCPLCRRGGGLCRCEPWRLPD